MGCGISRVFAVVVMLLGLTALAGAENFDPDRATYDPESKFVITPYGAILGIRRN